MAYWNKGTAFGFGKKFRDYKIVEYRRGEIWIAVGLTEYGELIYFVRYWKDGETIWTDGTALSDSVFPYAKSIDLFLSEKDGYLQATVDTGEHIQPFWIDPKDIEEIPDDKPGKIKEAYRYFNSGIICSPFYIPDIIINKSEFTEDDFKGFIRKIADENLANVLRFDPWGIWRPAEVTSKVIFFMHPKINGKYNLHDWDPVWKDQVLRRIAYIREAEIVPCIDFANNSHYHMPDPWRWHWLYRENNDGYNGLRTHTDSRVYTHFYEWSYFGPSWRETLAIEKVGEEAWESMSEEERSALEAEMTEDMMSDEQVEDMMQCRATQEYYAETETRLISEIRKEIGDFFMIGHNEVDGTIGYHDWRRKNIYKTIPRNRLVSSLLFADFYREKASIWNHYIPSIHGVDTIERYWKSMTDEAPDVPCLFSGDGYVWEPNDEKLSQLCREIKAHGHVGYERNDGFWKHTSFDQLDWVGARIMRDELF